ncbi:hypothetical protein HDU96_007806 [Phlyctochytrium bullatum]|nr:hypothetical protein HDU96_007806 [Phlyctochytrium bullatum]
MRFFFTALTSLLAIAASGVNALPAPVPGGSQAVAGPSGTNITVVSAARFAELQELSQFSQLSYCNRSALSSYRCQICVGPAGRLTSITFLNNSDATLTGFTALDPTTSTIYLSFRGSVNTANWLSNLDFARTDLDLSSLDPSAPYAALARQSSVHSGFQKAYQQLKPQLRSQLTALLARTPTATVHAVGHSLGCAITQLALQDAIFAKLVPASRTRITGFGCPRVGDFEYARLLDTALGIPSVDRIVHSKDIVPRQPPQTFGYRHAGVEHWINVDTKQTYRCADVKQGLDESPSCVNNVAYNELNTKSHNSYWISTVANDVCNNVAAGGLVGTAGTPPVKYLPYEVNTQG